MGKIVAKPSTSEIEKKDKRDYFAERRNIPLELLPSASSLGELIKSGINPITGKPLK